MRFLYLFIFFLSIHVVRRRCHPMQPLIVLKTAKIKKPNMYGKFSKFALFPQIPQAGRHTTPYRAGELHWKQNTTFQRSMLEVQWYANNDGLSAKYTLATESPKSSKNPLSLSVNNISAPMQTTINFPFSGTAKGTCRFWTWWQLENNSWITKTISLAFGEN